MTAKKDELEAIYLEYRSLREEIITAMHARNSILSFGLATIGVMFSAIAAIFVSGSNTMFSGLVLFIIVPLIVVFILLIWLGEYQRMHRAGKHMISLEERINLIQKKEILTWETMLRDRKAHMGYPYDTTIVLLVAILFASFCIGITLIEITNSTYQVLAYIAGALFSVVVYVSAVTKMSELRK